MNDPYVGADAFSFGQLFQSFTVRAKMKIFYNLCWKRVK